MYDDTKRMLSILVLICIDSGVVWALGWYILHVNLHRLSVRRNIKLQDHCILE